MVAEILFTTPSHKFYEPFFFPLNQFKCLPHSRHSIGHKITRTQIVSLTALWLIDVGPHTELFSGTVSFNPHNNVIKCSFTLSQFWAEKTKGWNC